MEDRQERERRAYDEDRVFEESSKWHKRAHHVLTGPNTAKAEALFDDLIRKAVTGGRALDICCGSGIRSVHILELGADYVLGVDLAESEIAKAKTREQPGKLEFLVADASAPLEGKFDLIFGRSALHHIDYRPTLLRLYENNLAPGGTLLFMDPLGENVITRAFHRFVPSAHTPDERPLREDDINWFLETFPGAKFYPINYISYPVGMVSSVLLKSPDNPLMRWADRLDTRLERVKRLRSHFRQGIFVATSDGG